MWICLRRNLQLKRHVAVYLQYINEGSNHILCISTRSSITWQTFQQIFYLGWIVTWWFTPGIVSGFVHPSYTWTNPACPLITGAIRTY
jgi:hypothetical protein